MNSIVKIFNENVDRYENWYENNRIAYQTELQMLDGLIINPNNSLEIGVGTGRFAFKLSIKHGIDPSEQMLKIARQKGIIAEKGFAENLPYQNNAFCTVLLMVTICFVNDPGKTIKEANRILKSEGRIIVGIIDKDSALGQKYIKNNFKSIFYKNANFFSAQEIVKLLESNGFIDVKTRQGIFKNPFTIQKAEDWKPGHGQGLFSVVFAQKK